MTLQEFYHQVGGSYQDVLARIPSEQMILKFVRMYEQDTSFTQLADAAASGLWTDAFRAVHTLKGVAQNLGFETLQKAAFTLTEALRPGNPLADPALLEQVRSAHEQVMCALRQLDA